MNFFINKVNTIDLHVVTIIALLIDAALAPQIISLMSGEGNFLLWA